MLTIHVTVVSAGRNFSKLKLLKLYVRLTMGQERLNVLTLMAIKNDHLKKMKYEDLVDEFVSKSIRRITLFRLKNYIS